MIPADLLDQLRETDEELFLKVIGPDDSEQREALGRQLEELEGFGMIKKGSNGWRWVK